MMMNHGRRQVNGNFTVFHTFVCISLTLLLGMHLYSYIWGLNPESLDGDFSNIKYIIMQLSRSLSEVNRKHEHLEDEMERISAVLPKVAAAAGKAKDALDPFRQNTHVRQMGDVVDYDRQIADYALETAGAKVIDTGDTIDHVIYESPVSWALHVFSALLCRECLGARAMISPSALPGECWAFKGARGEATIRLLGTVKITGVSIEHIPPHISPTREISTAPRLCEVEGLEYRSDPYPHNFGSFEYDQNGKPIQYFDVLHPANKGYNLVKFRVLTNWGNPVHTCVYRFRVHGELVSGQGPKIDNTDVSSENE